MSVSGLRVISRQRAISVAFGAERTLNRIYKYTALEPISKSFEQDDLGYVAIANRSAESFDIYSRSTPSSNFEIGSSTTLADF